MATTTVELKKEQEEEFDRKLEAVTAGLSGEYSNLLQDIIPREDALTVMGYMISLKVEINPSDNYRRDIIKCLTRFIAFCHQARRLKAKTLKQLDREDILAFLDSLRKSEALDPLHKWIGTYNLYRIHLIRFFKWLYSPDVEPDKRAKPSVVENIPQLKRKEKSIYKPTDLWTSEDDLLFLKYCPSKRMKCFHTMARDTSCRPHELLKLRIKDVNFKITPDKYQYAELLVNGKTGSRPLVPDSKFCVKCRMVLTYSAYTETIDEKQQKDDALATLSDQVMKLMAEVQELKKQE
jgi:tRNA nucleotidyltransferase/poly(A) polymerase